MSMTPVDKISVPFPAQASALFTQIAARMFDQLVVGDQVMSLTTEAFEAWKLIREMAHLYGTHGLVVLEIEQETRLVDAVVLAHKLFHRYAPDTKYPGACDCEMALKIHAASQLVLRDGLEHR
jgi:hypothetical protein